MSASALRTAQTNQWRELLVSPTSPYAISKPENPSGPAPEFELTLAKASTPNSLYLPELSNRYRAVKSINDALVEISPESQEYAADFAVRIGGGVAQSPAPVFTSPSRSSPSSTPAVISGASSEPQSVRPVRSAAKPEVIEKPTPSGAALILDYGSASSIPTNSLRGIKAHTRVSPFSEPGLVDISADVDFLALAESAINASLGVEVHGPVDQARFLTSMGIQERAAQLVKRVVDVERGSDVVEGAGEGKERRKEDLTETVRRIESGWKRLVDRGPQGMGRLYQAMAIVPHKPPVEGEKRRRPVGFGGDVPA